MLSITISRGSFAAAGLVVATRSVVRAQQVWGRSGDALEPRRSIRCLHIRQHRVGYLLADDELLSIGVPDDALTVALREA